MRYLLILFLLLSYIIGPLYAQRPDSIWVFGDNCAIRFDTSGANAYFLRNENFAHSISYFSKKGLIYLDKNFFGRDTNIKNKKSYFIFDSSRIKYQNQDSNIFFCDKNFSGGGAGISYSKGILFFTDLAYFNQFPPFTNYNLYCETTYNRLYVHKMCIDTTPVLLTEINKPILSRYIDEGFTFVRHANGKWWWLIGQVAHADSFYTFLIKDDTILGPKYHYSFVSTKTPNPNDNPFEARGQFKASQDGRFLVRVSPTAKILLYEFDRCIGEVVSGFDLTNIQFPTSPNVLNGGYGASFSSSGNSLVVNDDIYVKQYDLSQFPNNITRRVVYKDTTSGFFHHALCLSQLGPDNKIYIAKGCDIRFPEQFPNPFLHYLAVVQNPDELIAPVQVDVNGLYLGDSSIVRTGLPNMPNYLLGPLPTPCVVNAVEPLEAAKFKVYPNPASTTITLKSNSDKLNGQLTFYNLSGQVVYQMNLSNETTHEWNVSGLPSGIYYLRLTDGLSDPFVQKVVVSR